MAAIAPWRASGNVTGPVSSLIIPNTYGLPVAFFGVPNENELAAAVVVLVVAPDDPLLLPLPALVVALLLLELLDPHPAARSPVTAATAARLSHLEDLICALFSSLVGSVGQVIWARRQAAADSPR